MQEEVAYECPECGSRVKEEDMKCNACGAVFEGKADDPKEPAGDTASGKAEKNAEGLVFD